jgi:hypothetical protein
MLPEAVHPRLREGSRPGNLVPDSKSFASESAVIGGREQVPSGSEVRADDSVYLDETLGVPGGLEPPHALFPLPRWLMGVLGPVVQVPVLPVSNAGHYDPFRGGIAAQFVGNDYARTPPRGPQQLAEEPHCREAVALGLHKNIDNNAVLIHGSPEIMPHAIDVEEDFVQMPFVAGTGTPFPQAGDIQVAELLAPAPDRFIADQYSARGHRFFHVPEAHRKTVVEPNGIRDDFSREPVATVRVVGYSFSIPSTQSRST